jgi:hypothetical protein
MVFSDNVYMKGGVGGGGREKEREREREIDCPQYNEACRILDF